jgi:hypothetical protein
MSKNANINSLIGPEVFKECLAEAMQWYGVYKKGLDQKDLLPTAAYFAKLLLKKAGTTKREKVWVCANGLKKGRDRRNVKTEIKKIAKIEHYECMVDIYCCRGNKDPYVPLITMECEGCAGYSGEVQKSATSDNCDYLWDLFKLLQVPSPLRVFFALCSKKKTEALERLIDRHVNTYGNLRKSTDVVYAVVIPSVKLKGKSLTVQSWTGPKSTVQKYSMPLGV